MIRTQAVRVRRARIPATAIFRPLRTYMRINTPLKSPVGTCMCASRTGKHEFLLNLIYARSISYLLHPFLRLAIRRGFQVIISRRREEGEDMLSFASRVLLACNGCEFAEVNLMAQLGFVLVAVDGEDVGSEDDEDGLP